MKFELSQTQTLLVGTERRRCAECNRWMKRGKLTEKTPLQRCDMPFASICVECKKSKSEN